MNQIFNNKSEKFIDLHLHTISSDGTYAPEKVVRLAQERGFRTIAITDHDTTEGLEEAISAGIKYNIEVIPGIELTVDYAQTEMHILGYFINKDSSAFQNILLDLRETRLNRAIKMAEKLKELGISIPIQKIISVNCESAIGRLHIANALISEGYVSNINEAMSRYLRKGRPAYVPKKHLLPSEGIKLIKDVGGVAVLAHPGMGNLERFLPALIEFGMEGIEVFHSKHNEGQIKKYLHLADEYKLLITGGSDCHGLGKDQELLGTIHLPEKYLIQLKDYYTKKGLQAKI